MLQRKPFDSAFWGNSPWQLLERLQREHSPQGLLADRAREPQLGNPQIWIAEDDAVLAFDAPGATKESFDIIIEKDVVKISGRIEQDELPEQAQWLQRGRKTGEFSQSFRLPFEVDPEGVHAAFQEGVLSIKLPRSAVSKPKKISIH